MTVRYSRLYAPRYRRESDFLSCWLAGAVAVAVASAWGWTDVTSLRTPLAAVEIQPNAIQVRDEPMLVAVTGISDQVVYFWILKDCDGHLTTAEFSATCPPVATWQRQLGTDGHLRERLSFDGVADERGGAGRVPVGVNLWLRVSTDPRGVRDYRDVMFAVADAPCGPWVTLLGMFGWGRCSSGLPDLVGAANSR